MGQVKEVNAIPNLYTTLSEEGFQSSKLTYLGGLWVLIRFDSLDILEKFHNHVGLPINAWTTNTFSNIASKWGDLVVWEESEENVLDSSSFEEGFYELVEENKFEDKDLDNVKVDSDVEKVLKTSGMKENEIGNDNEHSIHGEENIYSSDPFNIYELLQKKKDNIHQTKESDPTHLPGFTPELGNNNKEEGSNSVNDQRKSVLGKKIFSYHNVEASTHHTTCMPITEGSILDVMDDLVKMLWGNLVFDHAVNSSIGEMEKLWSWVILMKFERCLVDLPLGGYSYI
nr:hypothetical protein [Tanacetum cinerariifolium]